MTQCAQHAPLLDVQDLCITFHSEGHCLQAVEHVNFSIEQGEIFCLVGESGCGKSLTAKALLQLTPDNAQLTGKIVLDQCDLLSLSAKQMQGIRGKKAGMIFQEPMTALNPVLRVGHQCAEHMQLHEGISHAEALVRCTELFMQVGIPAAASRLNDYPHQLSGGMRQRVMIAMALACNPRLLIADEPTTALDVTIQWQILQLVQNLTEQRGMGVLLITHDLGVVAQVAHRVGVMYAGQMVECGFTKDILQDPQHPYTKGLLYSVPQRHSMEQRRLPTIEGTVPPLHALPSGCRFHPRCVQATEKCRQQAPVLQGSRCVRCWHIA